MKPPRSKPPRPRPRRNPRRSPRAEPVELTYLVDDSEANQATAKALADAYMALHPNVTITIESRPGGTEGDNIVKTRLATGEMTDIFWYNSGSLLQALNPTETLVDISGEPFMANIVESFLPTVSQNGQIFGVPSRHGHGRRHPLQQDDLRRSRAQRAHDLGRIRSQQRGDQGGRHRRRVIATYDGEHVDFPVVRAR